MTAAIREPKWEKYADSPVETISTCCLLLLNYAPRSARAAGITAYPSRSKRALAYNRLLAASCKQMLAGNPLLRPLAGVATRDRAEFQKVPVSFANFVELAKSDASPYKGRLESPIPEGFAALNPPRLAGTRDPGELLKLVVPDSDDDPDLPDGDVADRVKRLPLKQQEAWATYGAILHCLAHELLEDPETFGKKNLGWLAGFHTNESLLAEKVMNWWRAQVNPLDVDSVPTARTIRTYFAAARTAFDEVRK